MGRLLFQSCVSEGRGESKMRTKKGREEPKTEREMRLRTKQQATVYIATIQLQLSWSTQARPCSTTSSSLYTSCYIQEQLSICGNTGGIR